MSDPIVHAELWSEDPKRTAEFYRKVFGWQVRHLPDMSYWVTETGAGGATCGFVHPEAGDRPVNICNYIRVADVAAALERVLSAGGRTILEPTEVPEVGAFALFEDVDGRVMGIWQ